MAVLLCLGNAIFVRVRDAASNRVK
jgi:hypothetical protein